MDVELFLGLVGVAGVIGLAVGWRLRARKVRNEHWLWKKNRLRRARLLLSGGGLATCVGLFGVLGQRVAG